MTGGSARTSFSARHGMMVIPHKGVLPRLRETLDHQSLAICHYTLFPTAVFNCNPNHIQLFRSVPLAVDWSRFECWELQYPDGDEDYVAMVNEHWGRLKAVVAEDVEIWDEVAATRQSFGYRRNILNNRECKITASTKPSRTCWTSETHGRRRAHRRIEYSAGSRNA